MALCHYLTDRDRILPAGIVAMSPWTDLTASGSSYTENFEIDPLFGNTNESLIYNSVYPGNHDLTDPYISPLFGDFTGFPPMLIQVGSNEMLLSDSVLVAEKAKSQGVKDLREYVPCISNGYDSYARVQKGMGGSFQVFRADDGVIECFT